VSDVLLALVSAGAYPGSSHSYYADEDEEGGAVSLQVLRSLFQNGVVEQREHPNSAMGWALTAIGVERLQHSWELRDPTPVLQPRGEVLPTFQRFATCSVAIPARPSLSDPHASEHIRRPPQGPKGQEHEGGSDLRLNY
jgi:hypothetical protein